MTELTQEELDRIAQDEADELLARHRTVVTLSPEELARLEREKHELTGRIALDRDSGGGPTARRLSSRNAGGVEAEPPASPALTQVVREHYGRATSPAEFVPLPAEPLQAHGPVDLEKVDPIQLAEFAEDAKAKRKRYLALQAETDSARAEYEAAQSRFMAYLQQ